MKLDLTCIKPFVLGALEASETSDGAIHFHRLPQGLLPVYENNPGAVTRLSCPAAVRLRFKSDTDRIRIAFRYFTEARPIYKGALAVNGAEPVIFGPDEKRERWEGDIFHSDLAPAEREFEIWLPHLCHTEIEAIEISDGARISPASPPKYLWLAYGDSITQGMTVTNPAEAWIAVASRKIDADVLNLGVGGAKVVKEMADNLPDFSYDFASIAYGTNDFNQAVPLADYESNLRSLVSAMKKKYPEKPVFLISVIPWADRAESNKNGDYIDAYRETAERVADEMDGVVKVSGPSLIDDDTRLFVDNVHPNESGMAMYGANFAEAVKAVFSS